MFIEEKEFIAKNGKKITIKTPEISDAKKLVETMITIIEESSSFLLASSEVFKDYLENISKEEEFIKSRQNGPEYFICVYDEEKIIGDCELRFMNSNKTKHRSEIGIVLLREYQGIGIGSFLFDELINIAKGLPEIEQIELDVISTNEIAKHLYMKKGFIKTGDIPHQLKLSDGQYADGERMVLFLNK